MHRSVGLVVGAALLSFPALAWGQPGYYLIPSATFAEIYDDNVFSAPDDAERVEPQDVPVRQRTKESDFITRIGASLQGGYQSEPFSLLATYGADAEFFADNSDLDSFPARQRALLDMTHLPTPLLTLSLTGGYNQTQSPRDLNRAPLLEPLEEPAPPDEEFFIDDEIDVTEPITDLEERRGRAERYFARPNLSYRLNPLTTLTTGYGFSRTERVGGVPTETHVVQAGTSRRWTPNDDLSLGYSYRAFRFGERERPADEEEAPPEEETAFQEEEPPPPAEPEEDETFDDPRGPRTRENFHVGTAGWNRRVTDRIRFRARGGARVGEQTGRVAPEVSTTVSYGFERGSASFTYSRSQGTSIGQAGVVDTERFSARLGYALLERLGVGANASLTRNDREDAEADVYRAGFSAGYLIQEWLTASFSYQFSFQDGTFLGEEPGRGRFGQDITRNIVFLSLSAGYPYRVY
jgi:hypothetical protein